MTDDPLTYAASGVNIAAADEIVAAITAVARTTHNPGVQSGPDAYAGMFRLPDGPTLAAACDGVGTKLLVAREAGNYGGIGQDLVAMNLNDLAVVGARPLFFLDYIAAGSLDPEPILDIVRGAARACTEAGCVLLGGETAEMPGLYDPGDLDLVGFAVGLVDPERRPDPSAMVPGDRILGLPSSGIHANGMSLARAALARAGISLDHRVPELGRTVAEELLEPTMLYVSILDDPGPAPRAYAHVTGGGLAGRAGALARNGLRIHIDAGRFQTPPIFSLIQQAGSIDDREMAATFNLGLGLLAVMPADAAASRLEAGGAWIDIGEVREGEKGIEIHD